MKTTDIEYYNYLKNRSKFSFWFRKNFLLRPVVKEFSGKVLDVGCGIGEFLQLYQNTYGIETNKYIINHCRKNGLRVYYGSALNIPFKENTFDGVFCSNVLEHLEKPEKAISEMKRVLKKRGILLIIVPTKKGYKKDPTHVKYWDEKNLINLLKKFNFRIKKISYFPFSLKFLRHRITFNDLRVIAEKSNTGGLK